jgi:hypothetical protein
MIVLGITAVLVLIVGIYFLNLMHHELQRIL